MKKPLPRTELAADYREFLSAWRNHKRKQRLGWVPLRLLPITGLIAYELSRAVDRLRRRARPAEEDTGEWLNSVSGTFGAASAVRQIDIGEHLAAVGQAELKGCLR